ncbi:MAG TPA: DUF1841 family protein [Methylophilaceae bacterium]|nr:DUF1841 family protein [Methylophilaceae bacterium]
MALFNPSRDQVRQFFFDAWTKFKLQQQLTQLEAIVIEVAQMHPEYQHVLDAPEKYKEQAYFPEMGETNPFLHMSLHMSILEQIAIDQPSGIAGAYQALQLRYQDQHRAQHDLMDCLAETIWQAQRENKSPEPELYLGCIRQKVNAA